MGALHRPLLQILFGSLLERWIDPSHVAFALGSGGSLLSDACGLFSCWLFVYTALRGFYATVPPLLRWYHARRYPKAPTSNVTEPLIENMKEVANAAFPLYATVPILTDLFQRKGWAMTCDDVADCGGWMPTLLGCLGYFAFLEVVIFVDHCMRLGLNPRRP